MTEPAKAEAMHKVHQSVPTVGVSRGELVVIASPQPTLTELTATIVAGHAEVEAALVTAVARALDVGRALIAAKREVGHGNFEDYVAVECRFTVRAAQRYMKLARYERQIEELVRGKNDRRSYLTINEALRFIDTLSKRGGRKAKG